MLQGGRLGVALAHWYGARAKGSGAAEAAAVRGRPARAPKTERSGNFVDHLLAMPDVSEDSDFGHEPSVPRQLETCTIYSIT